MVNHKDTIFPTISLDRGRIHWEDYLLSLTPVQKVDNLYFKREDFFAPLGYGGINGSKLRQAIWMFSNDQREVLISGCSVKSPQSPMGSAISRHYGCESIHVIGATNPVSAMRRPMVRMATWFGAEFDIVKVAYNPVLQNRVKFLRERGLKDFSYYLQYGITCPANSNDKFVYDFHILGANQVRNIPDEVENIILPLGSCNSAISVLMGIKLYKPGIKNVYLIGIGPKHFDFLNQRLCSILESSGVNVFDFNKQFQEDKLFEIPETGYNLHYDDLHGMGFTDYQQEVKERYADIILHPTYEAKVFKYIRLKRPDLINSKTLFWIIGSQPTLEAMEPLKSELGEFPDKIKLFIS
jgi:hypothetical protein